MVPYAASARPTARSAPLASSATTTESSGSAEASRLAQSRVVGVCGGSMRSVAAIGPRHYAITLSGASRLLKKAHLLRWRPRPHAQRTESTPRVRPSGAASHLDLFEQPANFSAAC